MRKPDETGLVGGRPRQDPPWRHHGSLHSRVLEYDPIFRRRTTYWYDDSTREQFLTEDWDVSGIVEHNKALRAMTDERAPWKEHPTVPGTHFATIPWSIALDWLKKTSMGKDRKAVSRLIMDPDNAMWRTRHIRYGV